VWCRHSRRLVNTAPTTRDNLVPRRQFVQFRYELHAPEDPRTAGIVVDHVRIHLVDEHAVPKIDGLQLGSENLRFVCHSTILRRRSNRVFFQRPDVTPVEWGALLVITSIMDLAAPSARPCSTGKTARLLSGSEHLKLCSDMLSDWRERSRAYRQIDSIEATLLVYGR
jgi:hypothetical protein